MIRSVRRGEATLNKPILVTGGAGFIGSHLVEALLRRRERVRVLDDLSTGSLDNLEPSRRLGALEIVVGSVRDPKVFREAITGCGEVYHLAASVGVGMITSSPGECLRNNIEGVENLLAAAQDQPEPPRLMLFSSSEVYGKSNALPLREDGDLVLGPSSVARWSYASGKAAGEFLALAEHARTGLPVVIVRCFNTCGPRQRPTYGMVVPRLLDQALRGEPLSVFGDGRQTRCFSYVGDVVAMVLGLAADPGATGRVFNVGTDRETSVLELAACVLAITGAQSGMRLIPYEEVYGPGFQDVRRRVPDLGAVRGLLGNMPVTSLDELLERTLEDRRQRAAASALPGNGGARVRA